MQFSIKWIQETSCVPNKHFWQQRDKKSLISVTRPYVKGEDYGSEASSSYLPWIKCYQKTSPDKGSDQAETSKWEAELLVNTFIQ